ncbi:hypothetical protein WR25_11556 [Diploscapter pachys]|uniref:Uncharacterized protein n=1 Tax=Diploscapter pachys TaxID=2018661 RepID=A0A2A2JPS7_9BILA|nr:hypothetical protein WR25_11556 [Diploscapter pachys]
MAEQDARPKSGHVKIERHPDIDPDDSIAMREIQELSYKLPELRKKEDTNTESRNNFDLNAPRITPAHGDKSLRKTNAKILVSLRVIFGVILVMKYFYGLYLMLWVFFMKDPACDLFLQLFALFMLILTGLIATLGCCFVCCGVGLKNVEKTDFFQNAVLHTGIQESDFLLPKQVIGNLLQ